MPSRDDFLWCEMDSLKQGRKAREKKLNEIINLYVQPVLMNITVGMVGESYFNINFCVSERRFTEKY
jgi:hypothetical protein